MKTVTELNAFINALEGIERIAAIRYANSLRREFRRMIANGSIRRGSFNKTAGDELKLALNNLTTTRALYLDLYRMFKNDDKTELKQFVKHFKVAPGKEAEQIMLSFYQIYLIQCEFIAYVIKKFVKRSYFTQRNFVTLGMICTKFSSVHGLKYIFNRIVNNNIRNAIAHLNVKYLETDKIRFRDNQKTKFVPYGNFFVMIRLTYILANVLLLSFKEELKTS